ncbi:hypothetical protein ACMFMG_008286 [Clarireedia jacksonii]
MTALVCQYRPSALDDVEEVENYSQGGFHPIDIGEEIESRYKVVHKLGYGGFSTVWLARDKLTERYVALKILVGNIRQDCNELKILQELAKEPTSHPGKDRVVSLLDNFTIEGPNDLTATNVLFRLNESIDTWSQEEIYKHLGQPKKDEIMTRSGSAPGESAPKFLVQPCSLLNPRILSEDILLVDFGCAFPSDSPPSNLDDICLTMSYSAPEIIFDSKMSVYSDIWALGCVLFEIRSGGQLFGDWVGTKDDVLRQMVQAFGKLPEPWWTAWENRVLFFDDDGEPKKTWEDGIARASKFELDEMIAEIGAEDDDDDEDPERNCAVILEPNGSKVPEEEASQMEDLLGRILKWKPEERISIKEIMNHPWLS